MYYDRVVRDATEDEEYYFEINLTRSQLDDIICKNEDCEAAQKFASRGIGPLALKPEEPIEFIEPPTPVIKRDVDTQCPKRFPCGHPKCKYLNVFPDGTPVGCGKNSCKYAEEPKNVDISVPTNTPCKDPNPFDRYPVQCICETCGGYSISGKTCDDIQQSPETHDKPDKPAAAPQGPTDPKDPNLSEKPSSDKQSKSVRKSSIAPKTYLPFDQLQAAARKDKLAIVEAKFLSEITFLSEFVLTTYEKHFDVINPKISKTSKNRGEVRVNNNFFAFYVDTATFTIKELRALLLSIWNQSVEQKEATLPAAESVEGTPNDLLLPVMRVAEDIVDFITASFGMKHEEAAFMHIIHSIVKQAVVKNKDNIPPMEIPESPIRDATPIHDVREKINSMQTHQNLTASTFYMGARIGHKFCLPLNKRGKVIPGNMGWAWNVNFMCSGRLTPLRYYKPGAVLKSVAKVILHHKSMMAGVILNKRAKAFKKKIEEQPVIDEPVLSIHKRGGEYMIKLMPFKNPNLPPEENKDYSPMIFLVNKTKHILRVNPDGTNEVLTKCDCEDDKSLDDSETSEEEYEINYIPPLAVSSTRHVFRNISEKTTQCVDNDFPGGKKKKKKRGKSKGKKGGKMRGKKLLK